MEQAKQALQAAPQGLGAGGLGLGSARLEDLRGAGATQNPVATARSKPQSSHLLLSVLSISI